MYFKEGPIFTEFFGVGMDLNCYENIAMCTWNTKKTDLSRNFTVQRCLKCQVALLLIWICSVGSGTSIVRVITVLKISFWHYSYFREVDALPTSSNLYLSSKDGGGGGGGGGAGWASDFFVLSSDCLMKSSTSYWNVYSDNAKMENENKGFRKK